MEYGLKSSDLANQIDMLDVDLVRFRAETDGRIESLLALPRELEACYKVLEGSIKSDLVRTGEKDFE